MYHSSTGESPGTPDVCLHGDRAERAGPGEQATPLVFMPRCFHSFLEKRFTRWQLNTRIDSVTLHNGNLVWTDHNTFESDFIGLKDEMAFWEMSCSSTLAYKIVIIIVTTTTTTIINN